MERRQIQIKYQNKSFFIYLENFDNLIQLQNEIKLRYTLYPTDYYITTRNQLINKDWDFKQSLNNYYEIHRKIKGGGFEKIIPGIIQIIMMVMKIPDLIMWLIDMVIWFFTQVLNPILFFKDLGNSITAIVKLFVMAVLDAVTGIFRLLVDTVFNPILSGFWGYVPADDTETETGTLKKGKATGKVKDNFANVTAKSSSSASSSSKSTNQKCNKTRCLEPPQTNIPISVVLATILLPPLGVFMELGLKGWFNILLTALLTMMYYFPGLIYALVILYC
jgi:uncharacterized membrane protein YqaE (UPF0057 family)